MEDWDEPYGRDETGHVRRFGCMNNVDMGPMYRWVHPVDAEASGILENMIKHLDRIGKGDFVTKGARQWFKEKMEDKK